MPRPMKTSKKGLELIKSFEGFRARSVQLPNGTWVIGFGHTKAARAGLKVDKDDAELILRFRDLAPIEALLRERVLCPLTQNEFDALVSFAFNIGEDAFLASDVLSHLNRGDRLSAAEAMTPWRKGEVDGALMVVDALVRRRAAEKALFLEHPSGPVALPTAAVRPVRDESIGKMESATGAVRLETRIDGDRASLRQTSRSETAPQAAARAVAERITRIVKEVSAEDETQTSNAPSLGDIKPLSPPPHVAVEPERLEEPSVDEITQAISALVNPNGDAGEALDLPPGVEAESAETIERRKSLGGSPDPLPPPFDDEPLNLDTPYLVPADTEIIDDTETVEVTDDDIQRAMAENHQVETLSRPPSLIAWLPFALLSGLGVIGLIVGVQRFMEQSGLPMERASDIYVGPVLALGSGCLLVISAYYLLRALTRAD